jgi:SPP1 gp7 family putative phage head morphogenesis protein
VGYIRRVEIVFEPLFSEIPRLLEANHAERADAGEAARIQELIVLAESVLRRSLSNEEIENLAMRFANAVQIHQKSQLARQIRAAFGVDVFINDRRLASTMEGFVAENTQLIRRIPLDVAAKVGGVVTRGVTAGKLHKDIAKDVAAEYGFGRKRAKRIARDQVGKFYGQTNATRQKDLGVTEFIWRTSRDRRVRGTPGGAFPSARPSHYHLEGKRFSYDNPPNGELPGEPVLCRCWAEPVFDTATDVLS